MDIDAANRAAFLFLNAPAGLAGLPLALSIGAAKYGDAVLIALMLWRWAVGTSTDRRGLVWVLMATLLAMTANHLIGQAFPHPRPFAAGLGHTFISHSANTSFPSDHATFMWTVAFGFLFLWPARASSWIAASLALLTSWARVFLGLHFPLDIVGSIAVAALSLAAFMPLRALVERHMAQPIEAAYSRTVAHFSRSDLGG